MELIKKQDKLIVPAKEGKAWCRVIHSAKSSDFASKYRTRTSSGTLCDFYDLGPEPLVIQVCNGQDKAYFKTSGDTITEIKSYDISKLFPAPKTIKVTLEIEQGDTEFVDELITLLSKRKIN